MSNQPKTVVVKGLKYTIDTFYADSALSVFTRLVKIVGEPIARASSLKGMTSDDEKFGEVILEIVRALMVRLDEKEVVQIVADLLSVVTPDGQTYPLYDMENRQGNWRVHFKGKPADMLLVVVESVRENFGDFLSVLKLGGVKMPGLPKDQ